MTTELTPGVGIDTEVDPIATEAELAKQAIKACWAQYKALGDAPSRERLILHYSPLVSVVATRVKMRLPASVEHADLVSAGMFGLIDAIEKYSLNREVQFETYASARVRGAIIDELRALDWTPRSVRSRARALQRATAELEAKLHRTPTVAELAQQLDVSTSEVQTTLRDVAHSSVMALDELIGIGPDRAGTITRVETINDRSVEDPQALLQEAEGRHLLAQAMRELNNRERLVVILYYYERLTLAEIGRYLKVTESRVSQMHSAIMKKMRGMLKAAEEA